MLTAAFSYPEFDPVVINFGFVQIRWYALAYLGGLLIGWWYLNQLNVSKYWPRGSPLSRADAEELIFWAMIGIVLGGRLGYVLFYKPWDYFSHPLDIFKIWEGGMSFHGGLIGVTLAIILYAKRYGKSMLQVGDLAGCTVPIGLFLGRIANFINAELWGRKTDVAWAFILPRAGPIGRHPSQLYEAFLEGLVLFLVLRFLFVRTNIRFIPGALCGTFLVGYGAVRFFVEFFREPDVFLGTLWLGASMGQLLSLPMIVFGGGLIVNARNRG